MREAKLDLVGVPGVAGLIAFVVAAGALSDAFDPLHLTDVPP